MQRKYIINNVQNKKILFICGSLNQTTMMHKISRHLSQYNCYFTPFYADGYIDSLAQKGYLDFSILGGNAREMTINYLIEQKLKIDYRGISQDYDLVLTCSDLIVQKNIKKTKIVLVQEGMTDPKNLAFFLVKWLNLPRYLAKTSTNGLSDEYDFFCVASDGYKEHFINNGVEPRKVLVTGIPNFDNCILYYNNNFPHKNYVLVATSDTRETFKYENRKKFIQNALDIADGRELIFKLHPNEKVDRAVKEIQLYAPNAKVFAKGNVHEMIANCDVLITKYSTCVYTGIALDKEVYSEFNLDELKKLTPIQNGGTSSKNIAELCENLLREEQIVLSAGRSKKRIYRFKENFTNIRKMYLRKNLNKT
ncbi:MAG: hypothetical protein ABSG15_07975 [FCB group bacterium]|jgi:hypothetical protein